MKLIASKTFFFFGQNSILYQSNEMYPSNRAPVNRQGSGAPAVRRVPRPARRCARAQKLAMRNRNEPHTLAIRRSCAEHSITTWILDAYV